LTSARRVSRPRGAAAGDRDNGQLRRACVRRTLPPCCCWPTTTEPPLGREAAADAEQQRGQSGDDGERLPDGDGGGEHAEEEDGHAHDGNAVEGVAAAVVDLIDDALVVGVPRLELVPWVQFEHGDTAPVSA